MAKRRGMSIRYKILTLLTTLPLSMLGAYLYLAIHIFESDKVAYVFDSSTAVSRTVSAQVKAELNGSLNLMKPIMQEYIATGSLEQISKMVFNNEAHLQAIVFVKPAGPNQFTMVRSLEKHKGDVDAVLAQGKILGTTSAKLMASGRLVSTPFADERILMGEKVKTDDMKEPILIYGVVKNRELIDVFKAQSKSQIFLIESDGHILYKPENIEVTDLGQALSPEFIKSMKTSQFGEGTESLVDSTKKEQLVSFSKVGFGDLWVVSSVEKSFALAAVQTLISKSAVFFGMLICFTIIISLIGSKTLTSALSDLFLATRRVAEGKFDIKVKVTSSDEIGSLAESFNIMSDEVSRLLSETAEKARMQGELKTAQTVQETLFPKSHAVFNGLEIAGFYEPASECGGDWWHYSQIGGKYFFWIGDATGHGAPAALITSAAKSAATVLENLNVNPAKAMQLMNRAIYDVSKGKIMMTFFLCSYDPVTREFAYCNASHEPGYLIRAKEGKLKKKDLIPLNEVNNPRLGQHKDCVFTQVTVKLRPGDTLFFYTDGLMDIKNPEEVLWGEREFLKNFIEVNQSLPSCEIAVKELVERIGAYRQNSSLIDDVTFFMVKVSDVASLEMKPPEKAAS